MRGLPSGDISAVTAYPVSNYAYLAVLGFCLLGTLWLEFVFRQGVRRWLRLLMTLIPVVLVFSVGRSMRSDQATRHL